MQILQLTIDSKRNLLLPCSNTWHDGTANVFPSVLLSHGFQCQEVFVAKNLRQRSQRSSNVATPKSPLHLWWQQSSANRRRKKKNKAAHEPFNTLKVTSSQLLKSNLGSELRRVKLWPLMLTKEKVEWDWIWGSNQWISLESRSPRGWDKKKLGLMELYKPLSYDRKK